MNHYSNQVIALFLVTALLSSLSVASKKLPGLSVNLEESSVSGLSSGAFMTSQFYVVNSDIMVGAGIIAGGPYLCAQSWVFNNYITNATTACMSPLSPKFGPNTPHLLELTRQLSDTKKIDDVDNLKNDRLYIFTGKSDKTVLPIVVEQTKVYFQGLNVPDSAILYRDDVNAGHAIITDLNDNTPCPKTAAPYINDCDFMQSHEIMNHIYEGLNPPSTTLSGDLIKFDQKEFIDSAYTSMSDDAFVYVPQACYSEPCRLHVVFHGCEQGAKVIGDNYYTQTGYNYIADANKFAVLYPQAEPSNRKPFNPKGCWDFWGYSAPGSIRPDYFTRDAPQLKAVRNMLDRLAQ